MNWKDFNEAAPELAAEFGQRLAETQRKLEASTAKLANRQFLERAATEAVQKEGRKREELELEASTLGEQIELLEQL